MADASQLALLKDKPFIGPLFDNKDWRYIPDSNNLSYGNNYVRFDTAQFANNDTWVLWSEANVIIQFALQLSVTTDTASAGNAQLTPNPFLAVGPKDTWLHLIDYLQVTMNGTQVINTPAYLNMLAHFRLLLQSSQEFLALMGPSLNFCPDTADSWGVVEDPTTGYTTYCNNKVLPVPDTPFLPGTNSLTVTSSAGAPSWATTGALYNAASGALTLTPSQLVLGISKPGAATDAAGTTSTSQFQAVPRTNNMSSYNKGLYQRCVWVNTPVYSAGVAPIATHYAYPAIVGTRRDLKGFRENRAYATPMQNGTASAMNDMTRAVDTSSTSVSASETPAFYQHYWNAVIPLKYLHDLFAQMAFPMRCLSITMFMYLNSVGKAGGSTASVISNGGEAIPAYNTTELPILNEVVSCTTQLAPQMSFNHTNPFIVTNIGGYASNAHADSVSTYRSGTSLGVGVTDVQMQINGPCYLYFPVVKPRPEQITAIFAQSKWARSIPFFDHQWYQCQSPLVIGKGQQLTWAITAGVRNPRRIWIIPFAASHTQSTAIQEPQIPVYQSFTCTEPATGSHGIELTNFTFQVGTIQLFQYPLQYSYEYFLDQFRDNLFNGAQDNIIAAGLVNEHMWKNGYTIYPFNLTRTIYALPPNESVSFVITFTNNSICPIEVHALIEYERVVSFSMGDKSEVAVFG